MSSAAKTYLRTFAQMMRDSGTHVRLDLQKGVAKWGRSTMRVSETPEGIIADTRHVIK